MWQEQFLFSRNYIKSSKDNIALEAVPRVVRNTYTPWIHKNKKEMYRNTISSALYKTNSVKTCL